VVVAAEDPQVEARLATLLGEYRVKSTHERGAAVLRLLDRCLAACLLIVAESACDPWSLDLVSEARERRAGLAVIVLSASPTIERATEAIRRGAEDFIPIPFSEDLLRREVERVLEVADLRARAALLRHPSADAWIFENIVSASPRMQRLFELARAAGRSETPVLIAGQTGTGKELFARAIHASGRRAGKPFLALNCAALPRDLVESELFGHRRGAFSGATHDYAGLFLAADGGTLFLDEIAELPAEAQAKLLRVLQDGEVRPVGGLESRRSNARIVAATNRRLAELRTGAIREDLYFRLSVLVLDLPPLCERSEDIPLLIAHFLTRMRERGVTRVEGIEDQGLDLLMRYPFPGNVRELENLLAGICVTLAPDRTMIGTADVRGWFRRRGIAHTSMMPAGAPSIQLNELEAWAIAEAMKRSGGNKTEAAHLLGISRDTLYRKLNGGH